MGFNLIFVYSTVLALWVFFFFFSSSAKAKVYLVLMDEDAVVSYNDRDTLFLNDEDVMVYKKKINTGHDNFLQSLLPVGSYTKLYSYTHLLNGFALHTSSEEALKILHEARGIRMIEEDVKMRKETTHTPDFLGIPEGVWPKLGGVENSGDGIVIGMLDSGINPDHPSFVNHVGAAAGARARVRANRASKSVYFRNGRFKGGCESGAGFSSDTCNGKIVGARHFSRGAIAAGDFNDSRDSASPLDVDGHGSHTASIAAGNHNVPVVVDGFDYGNSSGMAPDARIAVYKAVFAFGGYMSDVVAAVDQAVEDGVDILSLSIGPQSVPSGPASFLNMLDMELLFASKAGVLVVQAVGNQGPSSGTVLSFSPWIISVAASTTDRKYNNSIILGNRQILDGTVLSPPTPEQMMIPIAAAADVSIRKGNSAEICQSSEFFNRVLAERKIIICTYSFDFMFNETNINTISDTIRDIGASGFIIAMDPIARSEQFKPMTMIISSPGIVLNTKQASRALWDYYYANTVRRRNGLFAFGAMARILDGRHAFYDGQRSPVVASFSSRGPDVNNMQLQTADVLKPNIMAPGCSIWAAWSPSSQGDQSAKGQQFALLSGTSMATPHVAGVAALIKQKYPHWSPAAIISAMMTSASITDQYGMPLMAQNQNLELAPATPFDYGAGSINPASAIDPGLIFDIHPNQYIQFLCSVPGVDDKSVRRAVGSGCPPTPMVWSSDLNTPSIVIGNLVGSRNVVRKVTNVSGAKELYQVIIKEPTGVSVTVVPNVFVINSTARRVLKVSIEAVQATNDFNYGEIVLVGFHKRHQVRIPLAVSVASTL